MSPQQVQAYRELAVTLCDYACNGATGRGVADSVYLGVVEAKSKFGASAKQPPGYSSCGDLAHWLWFRLGFRCGFINRTEHKGWKTGANLNRWCPAPIGPNPYASRPKSGELPEAGDVVVINTPSGGHVLCVQAYDPLTKTLFSADYGQPGGKLCSRTLTVTQSGNLVLGKANAPIVSLVSLARALEAEIMAQPDIDALQNWQAPEALMSLKDRIAWLAE